jgi:amidase
MAIKRPTVDQLQEVALSLGIHLSTEQAGVYNTLLQGNFDAYDVIDALPDYVPVVTYPRTPGYRPSAEENKYGAWYVKTIVKGSATGKLAGKTVVLKDNICLAGVPMMNGASTLEGYVPNVDATVVTRLLDAGATVVGNRHASTSAFRADRTPVRPARCTTPIEWAIQREARPLAAQRWCRLARSIWRWAATRAVRSGCRPRTVASLA